MRKYTNSILIIIVSLALLITSCKKSFLEVVPKGELVAKTYDDYNLLMNSSSFYVFDNIGVWQAAMLMGDDVAAEENMYNQHPSQQANALFQWEDDIFLPSQNQNNSDNPWFLRQLLSNLYTLNKILNEAGASSGGTAQQKQELIAEAKATRAFTNFQLINYFAKPYLASTAATDPGFPIITTADITATGFERGTVQNMYDFIISDLTAAILDLNSQPQFPTRWSKPAAEAFLGKVYLFMGKSDDALVQFNAAFADVAKMTTPPHLYNYNETFAAGGSFLPVDPVYGPNTPFNKITDQTESVVSTYSNSGSFDGNNFGNDFLTIDPKTIALYDSTDLRLLLFTAQQIDQTPIGGGRVRRYTIPYSSYARIGVELSELYLLSAEAKARTNDLAGAKTDVEMLRKNRMPEANAAVPPDIAADRTALIKFIIDERTREYAGLGYRWWDMRRLSVDPLFATQQATSHTLYLSGGDTTEFILRPERLTLRIPPLYLKAHPDMVDNP